MPVAVVERGDRGAVVRAASVEARAEQVVAGLRRREAEARCPGLVIVEADPHVEARTFEAVARAIEVFTPRFVLEEPGRLELPTRGPSRYFGGEEVFAERVLASMRDLDIPDARLGIADGRFAARLAARAAESNAATVIAPGDSPSFLAPWPVTALDSFSWSPSQAPAPAGAVGRAAAPAPELADLLARLGLRTLGAFAALPPAAVLGRFGPGGARAHRLAAGLDERAAPPEPPPPDLVEHVELDPPVAQVETAAFAAKAIAEQLLARLAALGLACTRVMIEAQTEHGERLARCWRHEGALTGDALTARVRWQLEGWLTAKVEEIDVDDLGFPWSASQARPPARPGGKATDLATGGLILLRLVPDEVQPATGRQLGFWGGDAAATERAERALARVQGMLGHTAVVTAVPQGGRTPAERVRWVPWGDPREPVRPIAAVPSPGANTLEVPPWPGAIPAPSPARVFDPPLPAELLDASDCPVTVSSRGDPSASPARLRCRVLPGDGGAVTAWAGPWAHDARWWDPRARSRSAHWQLLVATPEGDSIACLVAVAAGRATVEAIYD